MPDEVSDVLNVLLVGFGGKDNLGAPGASTRVNPSLVKQVINVGLHNWFFMYAIVGLVACNGLGCTSINAKLETADRVANTGSIKAVPIVLDDGVSSACTTGGESLGMVMTLSNSAGSLVGSHS